MLNVYVKAFNDVVLSRRAIHNMNTLYPDATAQELENTDNVCIICRLVDLQKVVSYFHKSIFPSSVSDPYHFDLDPDPDPR